MTEKIGRKQETTDLRTAPLKTNLTNQVLSHLLLKTPTTCPPIPHSHLSHALPVHVWLSLTPSLFLSFPLPLSFFHPLMSYLFTFHLAPQAWLTLPLLVHPCSPPHHLSSSPLHSCRIVSSSLLACLGSPADCFCVPAHW